MYILDIAWAVQSTGTETKSADDFSVLIFPALFLLGIILIMIQVLVIKNKNIRLGLILPFVYFAVSTIVMIYITVETGLFAGLVILGLIAINIPAFIMLLMMYIKNGKNKQKKLEEEKSKIKDLE